MDKINNLKQLLNNTYEKYQMNIAYELDNEKILYKEFIDKVNAFGTKLISLGLKNKKIGIVSENRYEWELAYFAIITGVGVVVPIDKSLPKSEIDRIIKRAGIEAIVCSEKYLDDYTVKYVISMDLERSIGNVLSMRELVNSGIEEIKIGNNSFLNAEIDEKAVATIIFTSGTTDRAKAVMLSNENICSNLDGANSVFNISEKDVVLSVLPLNHVLEGLLCFLISVLNGARRTYCSEVGKITQYMRKYKVSFMGCVPSVYEIISDDIDDEIANNINFLFSGGAYLKPEIIKKYSDKNIKLLQGYGMTETAPAISLENKENCRLGSCGKAIPGIEVRLDNINEDGVGEVCLSSKCVMLGYYNDSDTTNEIIRDGWFYTGDLARIDEDGYIFICGRLKSVIVLNNGKKVFPEELEEKINNPEVVKESLVFCNENKICAGIVCSDKEKVDFDVMWKYIQKINEDLPEYKRIKKIFILKNSFEKTVSGKIKRNEEAEKILKNEWNKENVEICGSYDEIVRKIIANQLDLDVMLVKNESRLASELMADSLDLVEMILNVEKNLNIKIPKEKYAELVTVADFIDCVKIIKK